MDKKNNKKILIVEDSVSYSRLLQYRITKDLNYNCDIAINLSEARELIKKNPDNYFIALSDLNLPDCEPGEAVDVILSNKISCIVLTGDLNEEIRENLIKKSIIDYIIKKDKTTISYIIDTIKKIITNQSKKILIVDDSRSTRFMISKLLKLRKFKVLEAENGKDALEIFNNEPDIELIITDYDMPVMNGYELITNIRKDYSSDEVAIIGISARGSGMLSAKFIKNGANDFLKKPFSFEEFYQRIVQNIETLGYIKALKTTAITDFLTGMFNRRYFYEEGKNTFERNIKDGRYVSVAMLDIDYFKKINDSYGHDGGDKVLRELSVILDGFLSVENIIARLGGEEFCIIIIGLDSNKVLNSLEQLREDIENTKIEYNKEVIKFTVSIGVVIGTTDNFELSVNNADKCLYEAKETGRNKIIS